MIELTTGDVLKSDAQAIVNTVNCEGYMGKGIAYQFKLEFPNNFSSYAAACKSRSLRPGTVHKFVENGKIIFNFPTKDKWREKSKYEYIEDGLDALKKELCGGQVESIAIPPLGCGNGGLSWAKVKQIITEKLADLDVIVKLYEPSKNYTSLPAKEPSLSLSHYLSMEIKGHLKRFSSFRLQKTAFMVDFICKENYFKFDAHHFGPYSHSLEVVSKQISEFQNFHKKSTEESKQLLEKKLQSESFYRTKGQKLETIKVAADFVNSFKDNRSLELSTTILYLIHANTDLKEDQIANKISQWSDRKKELFNETEIKSEIDRLCSNKIISIDVLGHIRH
ncbi:macro domain-containing protein [Stutzerimonas chloritidismutans]|uniref:Macro domain-containing protein n=1 Tax=Stutzerimonas chloritidismutans TaxID=203192 RepID=A0ACC5VFX1_STUCH|nr:macro domain-containing protein [Stutzerimonas chloritidismutans]MBX7271470.1 macro domain-containing protein [Stutzerimonas chloritidismutans]